MRTDSNVIHSNSLTGNHFINVSTGTDSITDSSTDKSTDSSFVGGDDIRHDFAMAMSAMYQDEVPLYKDLINLVDEVNTQVLSTQPDIKVQLEHTKELDRLKMERHGAIRVGTAAELNMMRRLFAVMGMHPVGYYDLVPAGVPVHSTAFRAIDAQSLSNSPFRVFTSLLRLDLIGDDALRQQAEATLAKRTIFTAEAIELIECFEAQGGLSAIQAQAFVKAALETFRWHDKTPISKQLYEQLSSQHALIADVVGFKGPHINHLTPRTLDIDAAQQGMQAYGMAPKAIIEGPPRRACPILLRQTSFKALQEAISFSNADGDNHFEQGQHSARFGEIEQRGVALTLEGRALYDQLLNKAREQLGVTPNEDNAAKYYELLEQSFTAFPDDYQLMHDSKLAYFYYQIAEQTEGLPVALSPTIRSKAASAKTASAKTALTDLLEQGIIRIQPIVYEDFLPVSAAGIFQSNLHEDEQSGYAADHSNKLDFEQALGTSVYDELNLYANTQAQSLQQCLLLLAQ